MTDHDSILPPPAYFEEQAALQLLVPRAKLLAALADAYGAEPAAPVLFVSPEQLSEHSDPDAEHGRYLPARKTPAGKFTQPLYAQPPAAPAATDALGAPGEVVKAIREYLGVHPELVLSGQILDSMALELSRIALDYPADLIGALALEELMQLGYTVEAGAILPPRDLPEQACEFFGVRPVGRAHATAAPKPLTQQVQESVLLDPAAVVGPAREDRAAVVGPAREDRDAWFALAMGAAASLEDAANCLRDKDAQKAAMGAATHVRESCNKLWWAAPALEAPAAAAELVPQFDIETSAGGRGYVAWHFANVLKRHDFHDYIHNTLAADFACALARYLQAPAAPVTPADAMAVLKAAFAADPEYAWSWHCGAWACAHDEGLATDAANRAAARLMYLAFGCDTSKNKHFRDEHRVAAPAVPAVDESFEQSMSDWAHGDALDAARYRWLRDKSVPPHNFYLSVPDEFKDARYTPREVDAAIDAAIAALTKEGSAR